MAKAKAKANNKLKIFLYAFITVMTILALFLAWTLYVLTDFTNGGPKTVDSTQDYYSIPSAALTAVFVEFLKTRKISQMLPKS